MAAAAGTLVPSAASSAASAPFVTAQSNAAAAASSHLNKKIQKALTLRLDSQTSREALKCLSGFFVENNVHTRRNLRSSIEGQNLLLTEEFIDSFSVLERQLESLDRLVGALDSAVDRASAQLKASRSETQASLDKAASLRRECVAIESKQEVLEKFLSRFRLSEVDAQLVRSADQPLDNDFFAAFERLEKVRANARHMLSTSGQQTSGVDILHETSEILEASYERMFVWVQQQCRGPRDAANRKPTDIETGDGLLKRVLKLLAERPVYYNHCLRDLARTRKQALLQRFLEALSQGDSSFGSRPIELQACDPVRYVGDMLAWIHENVAAEREAVAALMGLAPSTAAATGNCSHPPSDTLETNTIVSFEEILDIVLDGIATTLSTRSKQALQSNTSIVTVYRLAQVFSFFANTLEEVLHRKEANLVTTCMDLHARAYQTFLDMWESQAQKLRQGVLGVYVSDLAVPSFVAEAVNTLNEVLSIYEMTPMPAGECEVDCLPILSAAFDPLLNHCQQVASMMDIQDGQVLLINCISAMQTPLRKREFTAERVNMYTSLIQDLIQALVQRQASSVLTKVGLAERLKALREKPPEISLSTVPELHPVSLAATFRSFYNSLFTVGGLLSLPLLERIDNSDLRSQARAGVAQLVVSAYQELYAGVQELGVATHTPEQVRTLLEGC